MNLNIIQEEDVSQPLLKSTSAHLHEWKIVGGERSFYMAKQKEADLFHAGTLTDGWKWFGAHPEERRGRKGWMFRVWAPHAKAVSVVGDFNDWNQKANKLSRKGEVWEGFYRRFAGLHNL